MQTVDFSPERIDTSIRPLIPFDKVFLNEYNKLQTLLKNSSLGKTQRQKIEQKLEQDRDRYLETYLREVAFEIMEEISTQGKKLHIPQESDFLQKIVTPIITLLDDPEFYYVELDYEETICLWVESFIQSDSTLPSAEDESVIQEILYDDVREVIYDVLKEMRVTDIPNEDTLDREVILPIIKVLTTHNFLEIDPEETLGKWIADRKEDKNSRSDIPIPVVPVERKQSPWTIERLRSWIKEQFQQRILSPVRSWKKR